MSKLEKEKLKLIQEKCQSLLNDMLRDEDNKYCVDCDAKGPRWASWNLGIFLCIRCAGIHRNLGVHISKVKSVNLDTWTPEQVVTVQGMGNSRARAVYEAFLPDNFRRPQTDSTLESFIRAKYEHKKYIAKEWVMPTLGKVNWDSEIEETLRAKKSNRSDIKLPPLPKPPTTTATSQQPQVKQKHIEVANGGSIAKSISLASTDLLGLNISTTNAVQDQQQSNNNFNFITKEDPSLSLVDTTPTGVNTTTTNNTTSSTSVDDLGSIFLSPNPGIGSSLADKNDQLLTKESILSLYKNTPAAPALSQPPQQGLNTLNPFLNYQQPAQQQQQQMGNFGTYGFGGGQQQQHGQGQGGSPLDFMQLSSQMSGLGMTNNTGTYQHQQYPQQQFQQQPNMLGNQFNNIPNYYNQPQQQPQPQQFQPRYK